MTDLDCTAFLQWALPQLGHRWGGYRRVRRQVCKRLSKRLAELTLTDLDAYRRYLETHAEEWPQLAALLPITISRFWRDRAVFDFLATTLLPTLARGAAERGEHALHAWSAGCASGEEPYGLVLAWQLGGKLPHNVSPDILATDIEESVLERARRACYTASSLRELPAGWRDCAFNVDVAGRYCLRAEYRAGVTFQRQDIRREWPESRFDLILCRNLVFTYFDDETQRAIAAKLTDHLVPGGALVIGHHERVPTATPRLELWPQAHALGVYRRTPAST